MLNLPFDKQAHAWAGAAIAAVLAPVNPWIAGAALLAAAVGKEIRDKLTGRGTPDRMDAVWTVAGGVAAVAVQWVVMQMSA
jgi:hypothetical protein